MGKLLIYSQDIGSLNWIIPILENLDSDNIIILGHSLSFERLSTHFKDTKSLKNYFPDENVGISEWIKFLSDENIGKVFCSTSSRYRDLSNSNLIVASKKSGIRSLSIMDHWKGYDRFYSMDDQPYLSDEILCIDKQAKDKLINVGFSKDSVHIVGHPGLESITKKDKEKRIIDTPRMLIISQVFFDGEILRSLFEDEDGGHQLLSDISIIAKEATRDSFELFYRPHPKEVKFNKLPKNMNLDKGDIWSKSIDRFDIFIGYNSMALIEAQLSGKVCICLDFNQFYQSDDNHLPFIFPTKVKNTEELSLIFKSLVKEFSIKNKFFVTDSFEKYNGSIEAATLVINNFLMR